MLGAALRLVVVGDRDRRRRVVVVDRPTPAPSAISASTGLGELTLKVSFSSSMMSPLTGTLIVSDMGRG